MQSKSRISISLLAPYFFLFRVNSRSHYDVAIIGAGMSGLAAGIRLAHFGKSVCILERHNAIGGLNSFYSIGGRKFDVGLHAMTNYVRAGVKGTPLTKLLRQLRIDREEFALCEQKQSRIAFGPRGETSLTFTNDFAVLEAEIAAKFPAQIDGFRRLVETIRTWDDVALDAKPVSARAVVRRHLTDPLLEDMLFCPVMYYGSAQERDMEFGQFAIMAKALFLEGFARPFEGVRRILRVLLEKYRAAGGERRMKCGVREIQVRGAGVAALQLDDGTAITADHVLSSIGAPETFALCHRLDRDVLDTSDALDRAKVEHPLGRLSFVETITVLNRQPAALGWGSDTIVFFNDSPRFDYARPASAIDTRSGVICLPNNFDFGSGHELPEGIFRVTCLADPEAWFGLDEPIYQDAKQRGFADVRRSALRFMPPVEETALDAATVTSDMFTPRTITRFTGHFNGAIYGAPVKLRDGRTPVKNLYVCGTDQGFLGIVGAMLSGISMANYHVLQAR